MASEQQIYQMILQVQGAQQAEDLRAKITLTEQKIAALWETMKHNPSGFQAAIKADAAALSDLQSQLKAAERAASGAAGGMKDGGRAMLIGVVGGQDGI